MNKKNGFTLLIYFISIWLLVLTWFIYSNFSTIEKLNAKVELLDSSKCIVTQIYNLSSKSNTALLNLEFENGLEQIIEAYELVNEKLPKNIVKILHQKIQVDYELKEIIERLSKSRSEKNIDSSLLNRFSTIESSLTKISEKLTSEKNRTKNQITESITKEAFYLKTDFILFVVFIGFLFFNKKQSIKKIKNNLSPELLSTFLSCNNNCFLEIYNSSGDLLFLNGEIYDTKNSKYLNSEINAFRNPLNILPIEKEKLAAAFKGEENKSGKVRFELDVKDEFFDIEYKPIISPNGNVEFVVIKAAKAFSSGDDADINQKLFDGSKDLIYIQDKEGKFLAVNKQAEKQYGYPAEYFIGKTPEFLSAPEKNDLDKVKNLIKKTFEGKPQQFEFWGKTKDGEIFPKKVKLNKATYKGEEVIIAFAHDLSMEKEAERELKKLAAFANLNPSPVLRVNDRGIITYANTVSFIIFNENELVNQHLSDYLPFIKGINLKEYIKDEKIQNFELKVSGLDFLFCVQGVAEFNVCHIYGSEITDRKRAEQKMAKAKIKAEASDKIKTEFLAQMSHEIRTPINTILSFSSLIKEELEHKVEDDLKSSFQGITNAGRRIIRTIDLLLNMSELQTGSYEFKPKIYSMKNDILTQLVDEYKFDAESKGLQFILDEPEEDVKLFVDKHSVQQIFSNLLDNAVKYTKKGAIKLTYFKTITSVCFSVEDSGIGISEEYLPDLFTQFSQEDKGYTRKFEGNGLGLALVKKYCDMNKASINVETKKGIGSKFTILFPNSSSTNVFSIKEHI